METEKTIKVLYVDDELNSLNVFKASFRKHFTIFTASSAGEAVKILTENEIHVLISDQKMPGVRGTQLLEHAVKIYPNQSRILITAYAEMESLIVAVQKGHIFDFVRKPWNDEELTDKIYAAYEACSVKTDHEKKLKSMEEKIKILEERIRRVLDENDNQ
ncbi:MAG: response regulator [Bacteroidota bacterium]